MREGCEAVGRCGWLGLQKSDVRFLSLASIRTYIRDRLTHELSTITTTSNRYERMMIRFGCHSIEEARTDYNGLVSCGLEHGRWLTTDTAGIASVLLDRTIWIVTTAVRSGRKAQVSEHKHIYCLLSPSKSKTNMPVCYPMTLMDVRASLYHDDTDYVMFCNNNHFEVMVPERLTNHAPHDDAAHASPLSIPIAGDFSDDDLRLLMNNPTVTPSSCAVRTSNRASERKRKHTPTISSSSSKQNGRRPRGKAQQRIIDHDGIPTHEQIQSFSQLCRDHPKHLVRMERIEGPAAVTWLHNLGVNADSRVLRGVAPSKGRSVDDMRVYIKEVCLTKKDKYDGSTIHDGMGQRYRSDHVNDLGTSYATAALYAYLNRDCVPADDGDPAALPTYIVIVDPEPANVERVRHCHAEFTGRPYHPSAKDDPSPELGDLVKYIARDCRFWLFEQCKA